MWATATSRVVCAVCVTYLLSPYVHISKSATDQPGNAPVCVVALHARISMFARAYLVFGRNTRLRGGGGSAITCSSIWTVYCSYRTDAKRAAAVVILHSRPIFYLFPARPQRPSVTLGHFHSGGCARHAAARAGVSCIVLVCVARHGGLSFICTPRSAPLTPTRTLSGTPATRFRPPLPLAALPHASHTSQQSITRAGLLCASPSDRIYRPPAG